MREPTYAELKAEAARLREANENLWRCARASSVALRDAGLDPYPGRQKSAGEAT